jgi:hypothetical protein
VRRGVDEGVCVMIRLGVMLRAERSGFRSLSVRIVRRGVRVHDKAQSVPGRPGRVGRSVRAFCLIDLMTGRDARCIRSRPGPTEYDSGRCPGKSFMGGLRIRWGLKG